MVICDQWSVSGREGRRRGRVEDGRRWQ